MANNNSTTIKLSKQTKARLDNLKILKRETYEEVIIKMLEIINTFRANPSEANKKLSNIEEQRKLMRK